VIDPSDGSYLCISKETLNSRKFDKTLCQLFDCPHFRQIKRDNIGEKEQKIRKYIQQNKPMNWILENTPCSRDYYYKVKRKLNDEGYIEGIQRQEEEKEALSKTEPLEHTENENINNKINAKQTSQSKRNEESATFRVPRIKLMLNDKDRFPTYREALTHALYQKYRWTSYNIKEIKDYIKPLIKILPYNRCEGIFTVQRIIDLHERNLIQRGWSTSLIIKSSEPSRYLFDGRYTLKELWNEYGLEFPLELDSQKYEIIEERNQLIDLFLELKRKAIKQLETLEYLEAQYVQLKAGNLNSYQKTELKVKILTNPSYQYDPLYPEIKEMLGLQ